MKLNKQYMTLFLSLSFLGLMTFFYLGFFSIQSPEVALSTKRYPTNEYSLAFGKKEFLVRCSKCHGIDGSGSKYAPSLIDTEWLFTDNSFDGIYRIVHSGTPSGKMKGWSGKIRDEDIQYIVQHVMELIQSSN